MDRRLFLRAALLASAAACSGTSSRDRTGPLADPTPRPPADGASERASSRPGASPEASPEALAPAEPSSSAATAEPSPDPSSPTAPAVVTMPVLCREAWGAAPIGPDTHAHTIRQLTLHHSAVVLGDNRKAPGRLRQHQRHHQSQGWPDIAYHLGVDRNGHLYDLRPAAFRGDTFTAYDPTGHFLVLAEGNFDQERPSDAQLEGVATAFAWATEEFGVGPDTLTGHRDHAGTSCPGDRLYAAMGPLRQRIEELAAAGVARDDRCGPDASATVRDIEAGRA